MSSGSVRFASRAGMLLLCTRSDEEEKGSYRKIQKVQKTYQAYWGVNHINLSGCLKKTTPTSPVMIIISRQGLFFVGLIAGFWPAKKASKLNPLEALRYK